MNIRRFTFLLAFTSIQLFAQNPTKEFSQSITVEDLKKHLTYISSDELEGRDTGSEGQRKAAQYISDQFFNMGLSPIVPTKEGKKSYFQFFNLYIKGWKEAYISVNDKKKVFFKDFYPNGIVNIPEEKKVELVFVGYGISSENYNDYKDVDVKGKAVIFFENEPITKDGKSIAEPGYSESEWSGSSGFKKKAKLAFDKGAKYCFEISKVEENKFRSLSAERKSALSRFNRLMLEPSQGEKETEKASFVISQKVASEILNLRLKKLNKIAKNIAKKGQSDYKNLSSSLSIKTERGDEIIESSNVLGFIEGTDKKDEILVISAHYDHVGVDSQGRIYNGADDDGSGTCAIIELAEAFAQAKNNGFGPRRSILFMTVSGEEKGLLGSQYFTDINPTVPLKNIVCDLNIDMIGRIDKEHKNNENYVYLIGADKLSSELHTLSEEANKRSVNFDLDYTYNNPDDPNRFYYRSDHYNFAKNKIPVIFYFTGVHEDYHKPSDTIEKIMFPKYQKIVQLVFETAWEIANREERLKIDSNKP